MNQSHLIDADAPDRVDLAGSPGQQLRAHRQARGIEIERIASQLHLRRDVVEALEQDRYDSLPAPVYVAGYLRNYSRLLGIDSDALIQAYHAAQSDSPVAAPPPQTVAAAPVTPPLPEPIAAAEVAPAPVAEPTVTPLSSPESTPWLSKSTTELAPPHHLVKWLLGAGVLGSALALGWIYRADFATFVAPAVPPAAEDAAELNPSASAPEMASPITDAPAPLPESAPEDAPEMTPQVLPLAETPPVSLENPPAPSSVTEPAAATASASTAAPVEVVLEFTKTAWLSVTGADGSIVLTGKIREGERRVLKGQPPYQFVMGKANAIKMTVNGQPFDVMANARGNVARFSFDPAATTPATSDDE
mgnify:CR=1 FL=1